MYQESTPEILHTNKMAEAIMRVHQHQSQDFTCLPSVSTVADCHSHDETRRISYESSALNYTNGQQGVMRPMASSDNDNGSSLFVVIPRTEYDFVRHELVELKQSIAELKSRVKYELKQLKAEGRTLKQQVNSCSCAVSWNSGKTSSTTQRPANWTVDSGGWDVGQSVTTTTNQHQLSLCSPTVSSPERPTTAMDYINMTTYASPSYTNSISNTMFSSPESANATSDRGKLVQLLPNYDVWVNRLNVQIVINEAPLRKHGAALFILRRIIPLVFTWDELACSRGQGLNCKTTEDVFGKVPLDPVKVAACKAFMRKFCADTGCMEPTERAINQTFSHQVNYARRRLKSATSGQFGAVVGALSKKPKKFVAGEQPNQQQEVTNSSATMSHKELDDSERYIQM